MVAFYFFAEQKSEGCHTKTRIKLIFTEYDPLNSMQPVYSVFYSGYRTKKERRETQDR